MHSGGHVDFQSSDDEMTFSPSKMQGNLSMPIVSTKDNSTQTTDTDTDTTLQYKFDTLKFNFDFIRQMLR